LKEVNAENITIIYLSAVCLLLHLFIHSSMYLLFNFFLCYLFIANLTQMSAAQPVLHISVWFVSINQKECGRTWWRTDL